MVTNYTPVVKLRPGQNALNLRVIVLKKVEEQETQASGTIFKHLVADETASVLLTTWDDIGSAIKPGDILDILHGATKLYRGALGLNAGRGSQVLKIGEFLKLYNDKINISEKTWEESASATSTSRATGASAQPQRSPKA